MRHSVTLTPYDAHSITRSPALCHSVTITLSDNDEMWGAVAYRVKESEKTNLVREMAFAWTDFRQDEIQARVFNKPGLLGYFFSSYGYWMPISTGFVPAMFRTTYFIVYGKYQVCALLVTAPDTNGSAFLPPLYRDHRVLLQSADKSIMCKVLHS